MAELQLTAYAKQDLADIWDYLAELNPDAAHRLIDELISKFHFLSNNPLSGKARYELLLNLRSLPHKRYTIFYLPLENGVDISDFYQTTYKPFKSGVGSLSCIRLKVCKFTTPNL